MFRIIWRAENSNGLWVNICRTWRRIPHIEFLNNTKWTFIGATLFDDQLTRIMIYTKLFDQQIFAIINSSVEIMLFRVSNDSILIFFLLFVLFFFFFFFEI